VRQSAICLLATLAISLGGGGTAVSYPEPAAADQPTCERTYCVEDEITIPGEPGEPAGGDEPHPVSDAPARAGRGEPRCTWVRDPGNLPGSDAPGNFPDVGAPPTGDAYMIFERCDGELTGRVQWANPSEPAPAGPAPGGATPPAPAQLAAIVRVRLEGDLPRPVVTTSPALGDPAIVNHPTFLAVDNWTGTVTDQECAFVLCVTVTATPTLTWTPGEPDAPTITCAGGGTRYRPDGPPPHDQAAEPGACAYAFRFRTAAEGRPTEWPGTATVTWNLTWASTSGAGGTLPAITRTADVPRAVDEVQAIVIH
jgi:hypothetical protein